MSENLVQKVLLLTSVKLNLCFWRKRQFNSLQDSTDKSMHMHTYFLSSKICKNENTKLMSYIRDIIWVTNEIV